MSENAYERAHSVVNRGLATVALLLGIVLMIAALIYVVRVENALDSFGGGSSEPPIECWDPGGGEVCAPGGEDGI